MQDLAQLLALVKANKIKLYVEADQLRFKAPKGAMTAAISSQIGDNKTALIDLLSQSNAVKTISEIKPVGIDEIIPMSFAQRRMWFVEQLSGQSSAYAIFQNLKLQGTLNVSALTKGVEQIVQRHKIFRAKLQYLSTDADEPILSFDSYHDNPLTVIDVPSASINDTLIKLQQQVFDLYAGPLYSMTLIRVNDDTHYLSINIHHIIADGWSIGVLVEELMTFYSSALAGEPASLKPLAIDYGDFAHWQRSELQLQNHAVQLDYWMNKLADAPEYLTIARDKNQLTEISTAGASLSIELSGSLSAKISQLCRQHKVSDFIFLLSVFQLHLSRLSGQQSVIVGAPNVGRKTADFQQMIGLLLSTMILRGDVDSQTPFNIFLADNKKSILSAMENQDVPFEKIVEGLPLSRQTSSNPLFQVFFNMLNLPNDNLTLPDIDIEVMSQVEQDSKFDITLYAQRREGRLHLRYHYNTGLFTPERISQMLEQYRSLLQQIVADSSQTLGCYWLQTNDNQASLPDPKLPLDHQFKGDVVSIFQQRVHHSPSKTAIQSEGLSLTYKQLDDYSNRVAIALLNQIGSDGIVAIYADRTPQLIVALLGIIKSGNAYLILDKQYPSQRLASYLDVANVAGVVYLDDEQSLPITHTKLLTIDAYQHDSVMSVNDIAKLTAVTIDAQSLAYIAFTSGSTGVPKAIKGKHGPLSYFVPWASEQFGLSENDRFSVLSGLSHDPLQRDIFDPLQLGATICFPKADLLAHDSLLTWLAEQAISVVQITPALCRMLVLDENKVNLSALKHAFFVGESLSYDSVAQLSRLARNCQIVNYYGATETQRALSYYPIPQDEISQAKGTVPVGKGCQSVQLLLINPLGNAAGVGELAEIAIRSPHLSLGYLDAEQNAKQFIINPFDSQNNPADQLYLTGDWGRYLPNGNVVLEGRMDEQVQIRGFRVETPEIEARLKRHQNVSDAVVIYHQEDQLSSLRAYVVSANNSEVDVSVLSRHVSEQLPEYMVPSHFYRLDKIPLTPNGKLDKKALLASTNPSASVTFKPPTTPTQITVARIWCEVLQLNEQQSQQLGVDDNFFALGGHSILATKVIARIRQQLNVEVTVRTLFDHPSILTFADILPSIDSIGVQTPIEVAPLASHYPLSYSQQRLWLMDQLEGASATYNMASQVRISGELDLPALHRSVMQLFNRHSVFRTTFGVVDDNPVQVIAANTTLEFEVESITSSQLQQSINAFTRQIFDLQQGPLAAIKLLKLDLNDHVLMINLAHIIGDGWSVGLLIDEIVKGYQGVVSADLPLQYQDYAYWQRQPTQQAQLAAGFEYWQEKLQGMAPLLELPLDFPRPAQQTFVGDKVEFDIDPATSARFNQFCQQQGVSLFMGLLSVFYIMLAKYTQSKDIVIGTPTANRDDQAIENLIGMFANILVLRANVDDELTVEQLFAQVKEVALAAFTHQDVPFELLNNALNIERNASYSPCFQVFFALHNAPIESYQLQDLQIEVIKSTSNRARFDLALDMIEAGECIRGVFEFNTDLFERQTLLVWQQQFSRLLSDISNKGSQTLAQISLLDEQQYQQVVHQWNDTAAPLDTTTDIISIIEQQAKRTPKATALIFAETRLTYAELNNQANHLAQLLIEQGVTTQSRVGIYLYRSIEMVVSLLAVLKAGGAYIPIDPEYPTDRVNYIIADAKPQVLICQNHTSEFELGQSQIVSLDDLPSLKSAQVIANPIRQLIGEDLAYIIYTSGSTGDPKGAMNKHSAILNRLDWMQQTYQLNETDRVLQKTTFSFDVSVWEFFWPIMYGATLVMAKPGGHKDPAYLAQQIDQHKITTMHFVPSMLDVFVNRLEPELSKQPLLTSLTRVICSGEELTVSLKHRFFALLPNTQLHNLYGPTEAAIDVSYWQCLADNRHNVPIGLPINNTGLLILDSHLNPVPVGASGELHITGMGLARGYLNKPGLTAEKFIPNPCSSVPGDIAYKTGDLARFNNMGVIEYMGRIDNQVKLRGLRIELGEVEFSISSLAYIRESIVLLNKDKSEYLAAYIIASDTLPEGYVDDIKRKLAPLLPDYMIPQVYTVMDEFPLTPNGKVNRKGLPKPSWDDVVSKDNTLPSTPLEAAILALWFDLLPATEIGMKTSFFNVGGNSLLATQLVNRINQQYDITMTVQLMLENQTIAGLAAQITLLVRLKNNKVIAATVDDEDLEELEF